MAAGIDDAKMEDFKVELLDYSEKVLSLKNRVNQCLNTINSSYGGTGKESITNKINSILTEMDSLNSKINNYITVVSDVVSTYQDQDVTIASQISNDISKIDCLKEE